MAKISFIHLSDIHFVKTSGNPADIDNDLRKAIIDDLSSNAKNALSNIKGILVSGDIAFSGNKLEYDKAQEFLNEITDGLTISKSAVYCVPGNHDVDQSVPRISELVYDAQCKIDNATSIDEADKIFEKKINDIYNDLLFKPINEYNNFACKFGCAFDANNLSWIQNFQLDYDMKLNIYGINSCLISNSDDHKNPNDSRLMYIGQARIPPREKNTVSMILCHHPPENWKFCEDILGKVNRRADIQLYGHKHIQTIKLTEDNVIISSGATQPVRGSDWVPRYSWLSIECLLIEGKRAVKIEIYPRVIDKYRDGFIPDTELCKDDIFINHTIHIDNKRELLLNDNCSFEKDKESVIAEKDKINLRELTFDFLDLPYLKQAKILSELKLLGKENDGIRYSKLIGKLISNADEKVIKSLWDKINKEM